MQYHNFSLFTRISVAGITPSNEIRDPPNYIRYVSSEPIDDETFYREYYEEFGEDESETGCFPMWTRTKNKISCQSTKVPRTPPPTPVSVPTVRHKYGHEKVLSFGSGAGSSNGHGYGGHMSTSSSPGPVTPPLSPGRRVSRFFINYLLNYCKV